MRNANMPTNEPSANPTTGATATPSRCGHWCTPAMTATEYEPTPTNTPWHSES